MPDIDGRLVTICRRVLYEQRLHYADGLTCEPFDVLQTNGQLMGSVLSFPILCAINFACKWIADELYYGRRIGIHQVDCLVNGDDIGFLSNNEHYSIWQRVITQAGFELSIGKNYIHRRFFTINSMLCDMDRKCIVPFFNVGLLTGQSKLTGRDEARTLPSWDWYNECVHAAMNPLRASRRFLHYHAPWIRRMTENGRLNLFISHSFGGLGFVPPIGLKWVSTRFQQARAYDFYVKKQGFYLLDRAPVKGISIRQKSDDLNRHRLKIKKREIYTWAPRIGCLPEGYTVVNQNPVSDLTKFWRRSEQVPDYLNVLSHLPSGNWSLLQDPLKLKAQLALVQVKPSSKEQLDALRVKTTLA